MARQCQLVQIVITALCLLSVLCSESRMTAGATDTETGGTTVVSCRIGREYLKKTGKVIRQISETLLQCTHGEKNGFRVSVHHSPVFFNIEATVGGRIVSAIPSVPCASDQVAGAGSETTNDIIGKVLGMVGCSAESTIVKSAVRNINPHIT